MRSHINIHMTLIILSVVTIFVIACTNNSNAANNSKGLAGIPDGAIFIDQSINVHYIWTRWEYKNACFMSKSLRTRYAVMASFPCPDSIDHSKVIRNEQIISVTQ